MISGPTGFYQVASLLLGDLKPVIEANGGPLGRVCVYPGPIAWDECECGLLAAALGGVWNSNTFPQIAPPTNCEVAVMVGEIELQLMGCAPQPEGANATAPSCEALDATAQMVFSDAWTMFRQVNCTLAALKDDWQIVDYSMGRVSTSHGAGFSSQLGGCVGSQLIVQVGLNPGRFPA